MGNVLMVRLAVGRVSKNENKVLINGGLASSEPTAHLCNER